MTRIEELDALFQERWQKGTRIVCTYHGVVYVLLGIALPDIILLTPLEDVRMLPEQKTHMPPLVKLFESDPEFQSVYTQLKADLENQQIA